MATSVPVPMAMPRSAWARAGASLTPSPTIATRPPPGCSRSISATLPAGQHLGEHAVDPHVAGDPFARCARCRRSASSRRGPARGRRRSPRPDVALTASATTITASAPTGTGRPGPPCVPCGLGARRRGLDLGRNRRRTAVVDRPGPRPRRRRRRHRHRPRTGRSRPLPTRVAGRRRGDDRRADRVLRPGLDRSREREQFRARPRPEPRPSTTDMRPCGDRAGLVEHDRVDPPRVLQHLATLDDDAELRRPSGADHDRRRRGQPERAGAGDDQHRDGGRERLVGAVAGDQPADERQPRRCRARRARRRPRCGRRGVAPRPDCPAPLRPAGRSGRARCRSRPGSPRPRARRWC